MAPYKPVRSDKPSEPQVHVCDNSLPNNADQESANEAPSTIEKWFPTPIGYKAPLSMVGSLVLALIIAICNYLMFHFLDGRAVSSVLLPQPYVGAAAVALAYTFKACLVTSLWSSFTQWTWYLFRRKETMVSTIDELTRLLYDFTALLSWRALAFQPALYLCALVSWAVVIATIFPPGALIVSLRPFEIMESSVVPVYDPEFMGDFTTHALQKNALFSMSDMGAY